MRSVCLVLAAVVAAQSTRGQDTVRVTTPILVGSEAENYLRYLQTLGGVEPHQWSLRGFSPSEAARLRPSTEAHPWARAPMIGQTSRRYGSLRVGLVPTTLETWYNSAFPFGMNDGAVWVGRGLTTALETGVAAAWGPISLTVAPRVFWTQNQQFALVPNGATGPQAFGDGLYPNAIDRPQRFGASAYSGVDPGQSALRLDVAGLAAGASTANQWWGPMSDYPFVLGNNAAGFPHVFLGTAHPLDVWIGRVHGQMFYGRLDQTPYSPVADSVGRRFAAGMVAIFEPRPFPGLELGAARFYQIAWPDSGLTKEYFTHLFETFIKKHIGKTFIPVGVVAENESVDNQLASVFARWALARSGAEVYAEYGREDHNWDARDLFVEPDHSATVGFGLRKAWQRGPDRIDALRVEFINFTPASFGRHRSDGEGGTYIHAFTRQGHTNRGQLLASGFGVESGSATNVELEQFRPSGSTILSLERMLVMDSEFGGGVDQQYSLHAVSTRVLSSKTVLRGGLTLVRDLNHQLRGDATDWRFEFSVTRFER